MRDLPYKAAIERGRTPNTDAIHEFLVPRISGRWLDIGCNSGWLLEDVSGGTGIDASKAVVELARAKGLDVQHAWATELPFADQEFDTAVMASMLQAVEGDWRVALREALRVSPRVIGVIPYPGTPWGIVGKNQKRWVHHVISPDVLEQEFGAVVEHCTETDYYFEIERHADADLPPVPEPRTEPQPEAVQEPEPQPESDIDPSVSGEPV